MDAPVVVGLVLGVAGLGLTYLGHPFVVEWYKYREKSRFAGFLRAIFLRKPTGEVANSITLYEVLYDRQRAAIVDEILKRRYGTRENLLARLRLDANCSFVLTQPFCEDLRREGSDLISIIASMVVEFSFHGRLLFNLDAIEEAEVAIREGYFIRLSKAGDYLKPIYELKRICRIENEILSNDKWSSARDAYFVAKCLPHRHVFSARPDQLITKADARVIAAAGAELASAVTEYVLTAVSLSENWRSKNSALVMRIRELAERVGMQPRTHNDTNSKLVSDFESLLSYSHKVIFGDSAMDEDAIVPEQTYGAVKVAWRDSSSRLMDAAAFPENLRTSVDNAV